MKRAYRLYSCFEISIFYFMVVVYSEENIKMDLERLSPKHQK